MTYRWGSASQDTGSVVLDRGTPHPSALTRLCRSRSRRIGALRTRDRRRDRAHSPGSPGPRRNPHRSLPRNLHLDAHTLRSFTVSHASGRAQRRKGPITPSIEAVFTPVALGRVTDHTFSILTGSARHGGVHTVGPVRTRSMAVCAKPDRRTDGRTDGWMVSA